MVDREQLQKRYMAGDVVKISVEIDHEMNLKEVRMIFVPDGGEGQDFVLTGTPQLTHAEEPSFGNTKRSKAEMRGIIAPFLTPNIYRLGSVTITTVGNTPHVLKEEDIATMAVRSLKVVEEPKSAPTITSVYYSA